MEKGAVDFFTLLEVLTKHDVDFIIIGGVCAVLHGAPVSTFDLDLVHSRTSDNLDRLMAALIELNAYYREHEEKKLKPDVSRLSSSGHHLLMTKAGPLDLLGAVTGGRDYDALISHTNEVSLTGGVKVRLLELPLLITLKEEMDQEKDRAVLPLLRRTLEEKKRDGP